MDPETMSIKALKAELFTLGLKASASQAVEKSDLVQEVILARSRRASSNVPREETPQSNRSFEAAETPTDEEVERVIACPSGNFYQILGVSSNASAELLKKSYRSLVGYLYFKCECSLAKIFNK